MMECPLEEGFRKDFRMNVDIRDGASFLDGGVSADSILIISKSNRTSIPFKSTQGVLTPKCYMLISYCKDDLLTYENTIAVLYNLQKLFATDAFSWEWQLNNNITI